MHPIHVTDLAVSAVDDHSTAASQAFSADFSAHMIEQRQSERIRAERFGNPPPVNVRVLRELIRYAKCDQLYGNATVCEALRDLEIRHVHSTSPHEVTRNEHNAFHCRSHIQAPRALVTYPVLREFGTVAARRCFPFELASRVERPRADRQRTSRS